jgi:prepilin-type N-terminal cleavage/methylation domain-containing protein
MNSKGFTLIEMLVSLAIFGLLLVAILGVFVHGYTSQNRIIELQAVQRDGSYIMETLSREIRMAKGTLEEDGYSAPGSTNPYFAFTNHDDKMTIYCLLDGSGNCRTNGEYFGMYKDGETGGVFTVINSSDVKITELRFYVSPGTSTAAEPAVTIYMTLQSRKDAAAKMTLQSTVAMRLSS